MGNTKSKSVVENATEQTIEQKLSIAQSSDMSNLCSQSFNMSGCYICESGAETTRAADGTLYISKCDKPGDINIDFDCKQSVAFDQSQAASIESDSVNTMAQELTSAAESTGQNLSLNPGSTIANSIVDNATNLNTEINQSIAQTISGDNVATQNATITDCTAGNVNAFYKTMQDAVASQDQDAMLSSSAAQDLDQSISSSATATTENALTGALWAMVALIFAFFVAPALAGLIGAKALGSVMQSFSKAVGPVLIFGILLVGVVMWLSISCSNKGGMCYKSCLYAEPGSNMWDSVCCTNGGDEDRSDSDPPDKATNSLCGKAEIENPWWKFWAKTQYVGDLLDSKNCSWKSQGEVVYGQCVSGYKTVTVIVLIIAIILLIGMIGLGTYLAITRTKKMAAKDSSLPTKVSKWQFNKKFKNKSS